MGNEILEVIGLFGVAFYLASYALLQLGVLKGNGYPYVVMNLIAASLVLVSLAASFNMSSAIIQIFWILISIFGIGRMLWLSRRITFSDDEMKLITLLLPNLDRILARKLLDIAVAYDIEPGFELTSENVPVSEMTYIASGAASVIVGGREISEIRNGLVGEMNVLNEGNATATVRIKETSRILLFPGETLRKLVSRDKEIGHALENAMRQETSEKLRKTNQALASYQKEGSNS